VDRKTLLLISSLSCLTLLQISAGAQAPPAPGGPAPAANQVTREYKLSFLRDKLPGTPGNNSSGLDIDANGNDAAAANMATFLTSLSPDADKTTVKAHENHLIIQGDRDNVNKLMELTALSLDVPSPLVKADVYTIQVNTTPRNRDQAQDKIEEIAEGVQITRDLLNGTQLGLGKYLAEPNSMMAYITPDGLPDPKTDILQKVHNDLDAVGFDYDPRRPLMLNDMLLLLGLCDRSRFRDQLTLSNSRVGPPTLADKVEWSLISIRDDINAGRGIPDPADHKTLLVGSQHSKQLVKLLNRMIANVEAVRLFDNKPEVIADKDRRKYLFDRTGNLVDPATQYADISGLDKFVTNWNRCQGDYLNSSCATESDYLPAALTQDSARSDTMLKNAMDAVTSDLQDLFLQPLFDWIREDVRGGSSGHSGIDLVGETSILVRDRTLAETSGSIQRYLKFTPIPKLTQQMLTDAKALSDGTAPTDSQLTHQLARNPNSNNEVVRDHSGNPVVLTEGQSIHFNHDGSVVTDSNGDPVVVSNPVHGRATTALGPVSPLQALLVGAAFNSDVDPTYTKINAGTSLAIQPFVLPGDGSARLQLNLTSTMNVDDPAVGQEAESGGPIDRIPSHTTVTETTIDAFDLQTVSSFGAQTTGPGDYSWRIPLLDEIPVVGGLFHGARSRSTVRQDSVVIVNLTILPRSLDLVPYFKKLIDR